MSTGASAQSCGGSARLWCCCHAAAEGGGGQLRVGAASSESAEFLKVHVNNGCAHMHAHATFGCDLDAGMWCFWCLAEARKPAPGGGVVIKLEQKCEKPEIQNCIT